MGRQLQSNFENTEREKLVCLGVSLEVLTYIYAYLKENEIIFKNFKWIM